ncbi:putative ribosome biogenesis protein C306.07c [Henckelia pumila]|uniref:putative ribosome biogenesis protein C306.07c n=1 Tax=Henckelia pumila TaxID=405737 RepID=UPI003C6E6F17
MVSAVKQVIGAESRVNKSTIERAVSALLKYKSKQSASQKPQLFPDDDYVYLNLTLKKIPSKSRTKPFQISLPHPLLNLSSQICLIIDDRAQSPTHISEDIKKLVKSQNIPISKVLKISKLKTNYKPYEAKRKLCDSYDLFLVDKRVVHLLPKLIGKEFFKKKKLPLGVDLGKKNLKFQVERALGSALLYLRTGTCCVVKVGKVSMEKDELVDNVFDVIVGATEKVPKKWNGVRSLHLKFYDSVALPIYQALPDVKLKIEGAKSEKGAELVKSSDNEAESKEMSGMNDGNSGKKKKKKKTGRIHELQYMDVGDVMEKEDDKDMNGSEPVGIADNDEFVGQKTREGILMNESDADGNEETNAIEDDALTIRENMGNKRNKRETLKRGVLDELNGKPPAKKKAKAEKVEGRKSKEDRLTGLEKSGGKKGKKNMEHNGKTSGRIAKAKDVKPKKGASRE